MPRLFGTELNRAGLLRLVAHESQVARAQRCTLREGRAEGVETVQVSTGSGLEFSALISRALDISSASYKGIPLFWRASPGEVHPAFFEPQGMGWMRGYAGGLLTTGGLSSMGSPSRDDGEDLGIHGRVSYLPADNVSVESDWVGDDYLLRVRGRVTEAAALGTQLVLNREIVARMGESSITIRDRVENRTHVRSPHMMLYHFNLGFPLLSSRARLILDSEEVKARDEHSEASLDSWDRFDEPGVKRPHQLFYHRLRPDANGKAHVLLNGVVGEVPMAIYLSYSHDTLPWFVNWKCLTAGDYVTGLESANAWVEGRAAERHAGRLKFLEPWESVSYEVTWGVLYGREEIEEFASRHSLPDPRVDRGN